MAARLRAFVNAVAERALAPRWAALIVLALARAGMGFQFQAPATVSPLLVQDLAIDQAQIGFLIGLYMLPGIVLALPGGFLGQRFGEKRIVTLALALMAAGGLTAAFAETYPALVAGRLLAGIGGVLLNVLMTKMVADWFAGRELVLAMAVFMNAFPIGIGLALLCLGRLGEIAGWPASFAATSVVALTCLLLFSILYRPHPDHRQPGDQCGGRISWRDAFAVCIPGAMWGLFNGAFTITFGFAPSFLVSGGMGMSEAGFLVGLATWLTVASVQTGGLVAQRWGKTDLLVLAGATIWAAGLLLLPSADPAPILVVVGLFLGLPVGIIVSMPARVLPSESRAVGMGVFFTWLYVGHSALPPVAGWLQDATGDAAAPFYFAGLLVLTIIPLHVLFRWRIRTND